MIVKLQPAQISMRWEAIKYAYMQANRVPEELQSDSAIKLLENLMSGKSDCWIIFEDTKEGRQANAIGITSILRQTVKGYDYLEIGTLYGLRKMSNELALDSMNKVKSFAKANGCKMISANTASRRVKELLHLTNFKEAYTTYTFDL